MPQLAIDKDFLSRYAKLDKPVRKAVEDTLERFSDLHHAGQHLEKVTQARDPRVRTIRVTRDWRGVVLAPEEGDTYMLVSVLPHDEAYEYVRNRRFSVNTALGVLEVRDEGRMETMSQVLQPVAQAAQQRLFDGFRDRDLHALGIDEQTLTIVRLLVEEEHLDAIRPMMPASQHNVLVALASGMSVDEAWHEASRDLVDEEPPADIDPNDLGAAIRRTPDRAAVVDGPEELRDILEHPFDAWRTFLHPRQHRIAYRPSYGGPVMVTGGAGTGKTVTAVHRAAHLAGRYTPPDGTPILLTTFTTSLAEALRHQLGLLVRPPLDERVDVRNIDKVAVEVVRDATGGTVEVRSERELLWLWEEAARDTGLTGAFLFQEWEHVILAQDLGTERGYLQCQRRGRGSRLGQQQRRAVWQAVLRATRRMADEGLRTFPQVAQEAAAILEREGHRPYRHVLVDEAHDLHPAKWRLVRALAPEGPDDLFVTGDPHQRIYDHRVSLAALGINVRGRSHRLSVSYRSTQEILSWAVGVLGSAPVSGLDDLEDRLDDYSSLLRGRRPEVAAYETREAELDGLAARVAEWVEHGVEPDAVGVAARTRSAADSVRKRLAAAGVATTKLTGSGGVRVGTMHGMKGLEFRCVAVVGVDAGRVPLDHHLTPREEDPVAHGHDLQRERNLLFVACTRARDALAVSYSGEASPFLPG
ncbi:UvrD-like helicase family protein [Haloactinospora alba]|uniref:DNA 3'-5' helicase n=1 Tax=Haloactinospora alba TaxID=405555 RepID=A0A543NL32_9ACTN|nr:UvrD-helicase domain-containing protein [Haloactinospora alba]TQN32538.1 UvrD-like helicase family protein [Haloactinospora alba]